MKKEIINNHKNIIFNYKFLIIIIYHFCILYLIFHFRFEKFIDYWIGLGVVHKLSLMLTESIRYQELITYIFIFSLYPLFRYSLF